MAPTKDEIERVAKALCKYEHRMADFEKAWADWHSNFESLAEIAIMALRTSTPDKPQDDSLPHCGDCVWYNEWCCTMNCYPCEATRKIYP